MWLWFLQACAPFGAIPSRRYSVKSPVVLPLSLPASVSAASPQADPLSRSPQAKPAAPCESQPSAASSQPCRSVQSDPSAQISPSAGHDYATSDADSDEIDDGFENPFTGVPPFTSSEPSALTVWTPQAIEAAAKNDPTSLGPLSIGQTSSGVLLNGVAMPSGDHWTVVDAGHAWATKETIDYLTRSIEKVHERFPDSAKMHIGHISAKDGGHLAPHVSHQAGRDVDVSYYLNTSSSWYTVANASNLDLPRTWAFVKALITETDVEIIFIDRSIQKLLRDYAEVTGESPGWLDTIFPSSITSPPPIIRHANGHSTHIHVRFYNPIAQELGRRAYAHLVRYRRLKLPTYYVEHKVKKGETLALIAKKYGTSPEVIRKVNGIRGGVRAKQVCRIPRHGQVALVDRPIAIPPRRIPPSSAAASMKPKGAAG